MEKLFFLTLFLATFGLSTAASSSTSAPPKPSEWQAAGSTSMAIALDALDTKNCIGGQQEQCE